MRFDFHRLLTPSAWIQVGKTDWEWDAELNAYLDTNPPILAKDWAVVKFPKYNLWVSTYPWSYGHVWSWDIDKKAKLPSVKTRKRLRAYIN